MAELKNRSPTASPSSRNGTPGSPKDTLNNECYKEIRNTMNIHHTRTRDLLIAALAVAVPGNLLAAEKGAPRTSSQGAPFAFPAFTTPADAVRLKPGDDIQAAIDSHKPGTAFVLTKGLYRTGNLKPKEGNSFYGELNADGTLGTIFNGSRLIKSFQTLPNGQWAITGQTQQNGITQFQFHHHASETAVESARQSLGPGTATQPQPARWRLPGDHEGCGQRRGCPQRHCHTNHQTEAEP
jgi:hypothetical protein